MDKLPLVSIVIPVYKTEKYLSDCIKSVINQTYKNLEILIVDDGSPDNSYLIAEKYCDSDRRVFLIRQENMGLSGARNTGIEHSNGKFVLFLDSDDTLLENTVEGLLQVALEEDADVIIPMCYYKVFENTGEQSLCYHFKKDCCTNNPIDFALNIIIGKGRAWRAHSLLYRVNIIKDNNVKFPVGYTSEDIIFNLEFLKHALKISFYDEATVFYLKRAGSITTSFDRDFFKTILFIDDTVNDFIVKINNETKENLLKKDALLCRNVVVYLISIMSKSNKVSCKEKSRIVDEMFNDKRVEQAFKNKVNLPFFDSRLIVWYFSYTYFLLRHRCYFLAKLSTYFVTCFKTDI